MVRLRDKCRVDEIDVVAVDVLERKRLEGENFYIFDVHVKILQLSVGKTPAIENHIAVGENL